jgi:hypothetical protein
MVVKIMEENPGEHAEACTALESLFKDLGESPFAIKVSAEILHHEDRIGSQYYSSACTPNSFPFMYSQKAPLLI